MVGGAFNDIFTAGERKTRGLVVPSEERRKTIDIQGTGSNLRCIFFFSIFSRRGFVFLEDIFYSVKV